MPDEPGVLRLADIDSSELRRLLSAYQLSLTICPDQDPIPASFWGDDEAGLRGDVLHARTDTPLHSILHEACHYICMDSARRDCLDSDAGSDDDEENAVCYLQVLLADQLACLGRERLFCDMDAWGYSFRLGSSQAWFEEDALDTRDWLQQQGLIDTAGEPRFRLR